MLLHPHGSRSSGVHPISIADQQFSTRYPAAHEIKRLGVFFLTLAGAFSVDLAATNTGADSRIVFMKQFSATDITYD